MSAVNNEKFVYFWKMSIFSEKNTKYRYEAFTNDVI